MNYIEKLKNLKTILIKKENELADKNILIKKENEIVDKTINNSLEKKLNLIIQWYEKNFIIGNYTNVGKFLEPLEFRDSIEKMAVWYELRYPEYEINRKYPCSGQENLFADQIFIYNNNVFNDFKKILSDNSEILDATFSNIKWNEVFSYEVYLESLPWNEKWYLLLPNISEIMHINNKESFHLDSNGIIVDSEVIDNISQLNQIRYYDFQGWHFSDAIQYLKLEGHSLNHKDIINYELKAELKKQFLNAVMYRIIERGQNRIGPRRGFEFALEFNLDIDVPMKYGVDLSDPGLSYFINQYIKFGGRTDLECLCGYGSRESNDEIFVKCTINQLIQENRNGCADKYTDEETMLHQRLVDSLNDHYTEKIHARSRKK